MLISQKTHAFHVEQYQYLFLTLIHNIAPHFRYPSLRYVRNDPRIMEDVVAGAAL